MPRPLRLLIASLSFGVAAYAVVMYSAVPLGKFLHPDMRAAFEAHRIGILSHVFGAAFALLLGPLQFSARLRTRWPRLHRWTGRVYLVAGVIVGGLAGLYMAMFAFGGVPARLGFGILAILWLHSGARAWQSIRAGDLPAHRRWMVRNFALAFAAVTLRLWLPLSQVIGVPFEIAYPVIAWLCWVPNVWVAERLLDRWPRPGALTTSA